MRDKTSLGEILPRYGSNFFQGSGAMNATTIVAGKPKLLDRVRGAVRVRHLARSTEKTYVYWCRRYILYHNKRHPIDMGKHKSRRS